MWSFAKSERLRPNPRRCETLTTSRLDTVPLKRNKWKGTQEAQGRTQEAHEILCLLCFRLVLLVFLPRNVALSDLESPNVVAGFGLVVPERSVRLESSHPFEKMRQWTSQHIVHTTHCECGAAFGVAPSYW